ncbi:MAG: hypothetical protein ABR518_02875 [Actinomycetota bacterium]
MANHHAAGGRCPSCRSDELVVVELALSEGTPLEFAFCTRCERRGWDATGRNLALTSVLDLAARR